MKNLFVWTFIVILVLFLIGCGTTSTQTQITPSQKKMEEQPIKRISASDPRKSAVRISLPFHKKGNIGRESGTQAKMYKLEIARQNTVVVSLEMLKGDPDLELQLLNEQGDSIATGMGVGSFQKLAATVNHGIYYIQVQTPTYRNEDDSYFLTVVSTSDKGSSRENPLYLVPNDSINDTVGEKNGTLSRWHKVTIESPAELSAQLTTQDKSQDIDLILHNSVGETLVTGTNTGPTEQISKKVVEGVYYIEAKTVKSCSGCDYLLKLKTEFLGLKAPGASRERAITLNAGNGLISGHLGDIYGLKERWYKVSSNGKYFVEIQFMVNKPLSEIRIELLDAHDNPQILVPHLQKNYTFNIKANAGTYYLRVFTPQKVGESKYQLGVKFNQYDNSIIFEKNQKHQ